MAKKQPLQKPVDIEAEEALIGTVFINPAGLDELTVEAEDFSVSLHQDIWRAMLALHGANEPVDYVTVTDRMRRLRTLQKNELGAVTKLVATVHTYLHAGQYAAIVKEMARRRRLEEVGKEIVQLAWNRERGLDEALSESEAQLAAIQNGGGKVTYNGFRTILDEVSSPEEAGVQRVFTGYKGVDSTTLGVESGRYWVLAGTPGTGKTAFQVNLVRGVCNSEDKVAVLYVHPEQHQTEIATLLITSATNDIRPARIKILRTPPDERERYAKALAGISTLAKEKIFGAGYNMADLTANVTDREMRVMRVMSDTLSEKITYLDPAGMNIHQLRREFRRVRRMVDRQMGEDTFLLIALDGLHLLPGAGENNRHLELTTISRNLKIAAQNDIEPGAIIASHQQNYQSYRDMSNWNPSLRDLRDSGSIGQDADVVGFLWRPSVHSLKLEPNDSVYRPDKKDWDWLRLIVKKNRQTSALFRANMWMNKGTVRLIEEGGA